ncbi:MAG: M67 family metallopeptidase [Chloroflexota bacterium]|nr:M67 family metallopeptidase [Chloroflexota bacterium]
MQVRLPETLQQQIFAQLQAEYPHEGGGFLLGSVGGDTVVISDILSVANVFEESERHHRYAMTPQDWLRMEDEADARGLTIVGYFHSHPDSPAIPSEYDREYALPNFVYLITQVDSGAAVEMLGWRLRDDRTRFEAETLEITTV